MRCNGPSIIFTAGRTVSTAVISTFSAVSRLQHIQPLRFWKWIQVKEINVGDSEKQQGDRRGTYFQCKVNIFGRLHATLDQWNIPDADQCLHSWQPQIYWVMLLHCNWIQMEKTWTKNQNNKTQSNRQYNANCSSSITTLIANNLFVFNCSFGTWNVPIFIFVWWYIFFGCGTKSHVFTWYSTVGNPSWQQQMRRLNVSYYGICWEFSTNLFIMCLLQAFPSIYLFYYFWIDVLSAPVHRIKREETEIIGKCRVESTRL